METIAVTEILFHQPIIKNGVFLNFKDTAIEICDRHAGFSLKIDPEIEKELTQLLKLLQIGGLTLEDLGKACPEIKEEIPDLLVALNECGFLAETQTEVQPQARSGSQFYRDICRFLERLKSRFSLSDFHQKMAEGTITANQLIGYTLESYHVTHLCPRLLAPSLANYESKATHKLLQEFYVSELNHDHLIENSLKSVNITTEQIELMQPLPMTFAVCATLGVFAQQHPLSFKVALMLFEKDDPEFHQLFKQQCESLGLPPEFYRPILLHAQINEDGSHEAITKALLAEISYISPNEQTLVKKNMVTLMESLVLRTQEILDYYGNRDNIVPRCFTSIKDRV